MNPPIVSVILPTYNRARLLPRAIDSVLSQNLSDWELIIVNDGSTDNTEEIIAEYKRRDKRIISYKQGNKGVAAALNVGFLSGKGKYITSIGSDDEYLPKHLSLRVNILEKGKIDILHGGVKVIGSEYVKDKNDLTKMIHLSKCIIGSTIIARREVFHRLNGFRKLNYSPESDFIERAEEIFVIRKVDFPTYIYYRNLPDSICNNI